ncbi:MAG: hypothetical protein PUK40_01710 [Actinomycetaceae bacterium]|nr:hypothetical protein [Arcanobacterium sp.]MDD7504659.1 hypothetical protein [Actinomycetaceae bacterium]MDY6143143.1 hypothetical protein [Arcanobacterium sp.]
MTIRVSAIRRAIENSAEIDLSDQTLLPDMLTSAIVGVDLSDLGVVRNRANEEISIDLPADKLNYPRLLSTARAAYRGGIDYVTLNDSFRMGPDESKDHAFDALSVATRLIEVSQAGIIAAVPSDASAVRRGTKEFTSVFIPDSSNVWPGVLIRMYDDSDFDALKAAADEAREHGLKVRVLVRNPEFTMQYVDVLASIADSIRLQSNDVHNGRALRFALRDAASQYGRDVRVVTDVGVVISSSVQAAEERAKLLAAMNGEELFAGITSVIGTVYDVADAIERLVGLGVADGITFIPASFPTDLASIMKGVLPLVEARAGLEA